MQQFTPSTARELADNLRAAADKGQSIQTVGRNSKKLMGGPILPAQVVLQTGGLCKVLDYERDDLTVSVQAGMPFSELQAILAEQRQMIALDPPLRGEGTVGGIVASNCSGPLRRQYGTARDLVIGMTFATMEGKLVKTGGMVVKNVAGLDMGKLMIGSFGTLAVITSANFRVHPLPPETRTYLLNHKDISSIFQTRERILRSVLQPLALDLITPSASTRLGHEGYVLALRAGGSSAVLARYSREMEGATALEGKEESEFWGKVRDFAPDFMKRQASGIVLRISTPMQEIPHLLRLVTGPCVSRAASGVSYGCFSNWQSGAGVWNAAREQGWRVAVEFASDEIRSSKDLLLSSQREANPASFGIMEKVKCMFDPGKLLNRSRLYGRI
jgi:glycolate oxidase FAD binding subunit